MNKKVSRIILEDKHSTFLYQKNKSNLNITFNRVAFIFFIFFIISLIYSIHLIHLGSMQLKIYYVVRNNNLSNKTNLFDLLLIVT